MRRLFFTILFLLGIVSAMSYVGATSKNDIVFPVRELGGCSNETKCKMYCEQPQNLNVCLSFAEKHNLMSKEELAMAKKFASLGGRGPGGCASKGACDAYCNDVTNIDECVSFAERHGFMQQDELEEAKKVRQALKKGAKLPGNCRSKSECDNYCGDPNHMEECITFAEAAGFLPPDELEDARKALSAIKKGVKPPPCRGKKECDRYCSEPENFEACLAFGEAAGFIPQDELAEAKKVLTAIKKGVKPPPCRGKKECDSYCSRPENFESCIAFAEAAGLIPQDELEGAKRALAAIRKGVMPPKCRGREECNEYCQKPENAEECINFAEAVGFMSKEEADMARRTGGKGPGGCRGKEECDRFCADPVNQEICFQFGLEHGLIPPEEIEKMKEGARQMQEALRTAPPEMLECIKGVLDDKVIEKIKSGDFMPNPGIGDAFHGCFEKMGPPGIPPGGPPGESQGCICTKEYAPVCGTDRRTYGNKCELHCMEGFGISLQYEGPCEGESLPTGSQNEEPQSLFRQTKKFLANILYAFLIR